MRRLLLHALLIIVACLLLGAVVNAVRFDKDRAGKPRRLSWVTPPAAKFSATDIVALEEAERLWNEGGAFFLDARAPADFAAGHIAQAHSLPVEDFTSRYGEVAGLLTPASVIIVYCDGEQCDLSHQLMGRLRELGHQHVRVLLNGWTVWKTAGLPTETGAKTP